VFDHHGWANEQLQPTMLLVEIVDALRLEVLTHLLLIALDHQLLCALLEGQLVVGGLDAVQRFEVRRSLLILDVLEGAQGSLIHLVLSAMVEVALVGLMFTFPFDFLHVLLGVSLVVVLAKVGVGDGLERDWRYLRTSLAHDVVEGGQAVVYQKKMKDDKAQHKKSKGCDED
jgi:uncharacterized protein YacL